MSALLLALAMLIPSDVAALQSSKLPPNATNAVAAVADDRPVILGRATYATYTGPASPPVVMSALFDPGLVQPGDQFVVSITGTAANSSGATQSIYCNIRITQGANVQLIGSAPAVATDTTGTAVAWRSDLMFGVNVPGAAGQYVRGSLPVASSASTPKQPTLPAASIGFAGSGTTLITNTSLTGAVYAGGGILAGAGLQSVMQATKAQLTFSNTSPILVEVLLNQGPNASFTTTVQSGYFMGL